MTPTAYCELPATPAMESVGLSFGSLVDWARRAVHLLQEHGEDAVVVLQTGFILWQKVSERDLSGILAAFQEAVGRVEKIIAAIKAEFGE